MKTTNGTVGSAIEEKAIRALPLLGRNYTSLLLTLPGVAPVRPADGSSNTLPGIPSVNPSVYGQRQRSNNFTLDSASNNDFWFDDPLIFPPPEAIAELKIESGNTSSAIGKGAGASVDVVTKSGSNQYRGDVWYTARNAALNARPFFAQNISAFRWNQFGGALGGPIISPKTGWYFFGYYEGVRRRENSNFTALVPTEAQLNGNFAGFPTIYDPFNPIIDASGRVSRVAFPNNQIPVGRLNPLMRSLAQQAYPDPNLQPGQIPGANYLNQGAITNEQDQFSGRVDHQFVTNDNFFVRYTQNVIRPRSLSLPGLQTAQNQLMKSLLVSDTHVFSPHFLATVRYGLSRRDRTRYVSSLNIAESSGLLAYFPATDSDQQPIDVLPSFSITGYTSASEPVGMAAPSTQHFGDATASFITGKHTLEFGGTIYYYRHTSGNVTRGGASFDALRTASIDGTGGDGFASFLLGVPNTANRRVGNTSAILSHNNYSVFLQDNFRVNQRLTLNLGLRWDYTEPMFNQLGSGGFYWEKGTYYWNLPNPVTGEAPNVPKGVFPPDKNNFAPRFGLAYRLSDRNVLRASYGMYYDVFSATSQSQQAASGNWPFSYVETRANLNNPAENNGVPAALMPNPFPGSPEITATPLGIGGQNLNADPGGTRTPYTHQWSFSAQHQFTDTTGVELVYFGSRSVGLTGQIIENIAPVPGSSPLASRLIYPNLQVGYVSNYHNNFDAWYNGASIKLERRFSRGFSFNVNYTWSKTLDYLDSMSGSDGANPTRWNAERFKGPAGFDIPHRLVFSYIYELPFRPSSGLAKALLGGWAVAGISQFDNGLPYGIWVSQDWANTGSSGRLYQFANVVGDASLSDPTPARWFNTAAFTLPERFGPTGNVGRNTLRGDGMVNSDVALSKTWRFTETRNVEFRADAFNLLNQTTFGTPGFRVDVPATFGTISSTRNSGRSLQMQVRFHF
ncbi:MAG: hypothetical protein WKF37_04310 [Bryobacteraceae bacterium]